MNILLGLIFLLFIVLFIGFLLWRFLRWAYLSARAEHKLNYKLVLHSAGWAWAWFRATVRNFGWRKCLLFVVICLLFVGTLPATITRTDYAIRSTLVRRKMATIEATLESYQGREPWRKCATCPYERDEEFGWWMWNWAYVETETTTTVYTLVDYQSPHEVQSQIEDAFYFYPGFKRLNADIERAFPGADRHVMVVGVNMGPMVLEGKKYPVVPGDYIVFIFERGTYKWMSLSQWQVYEALNESFILTYQLFFGPTVHQGFAPKQVMLLPWYQRIRWDAVFGAFGRWITWGSES